MKSTEPTKIDDLTRSVNCRNCGESATVGDRMGSDGVCWNCGSEVCSLCGCTQSRGCVHPDFPDGSLTCSWVEPGLCTFCFAKLAEEQYYEVTREISSHLVTVAGGGVLLV